MTALIDDLGIWVQLGSVNPNWNWQQFPVSSSTSNSIFRVKTLGNIEEIKTFCYLRVIYLNSGTNNPDGKWIRIFPKNEQEIIDLNTSPLFTFSNISRVIEVRKSSYYGGYNRPISDPIYTLSLEEFIPFDNVLDNRFALPQIEEIINDKLLALQGNLSQALAIDISNTIQIELNLINQQLNDISAMISGNS